MILTLKLLHSPKTMPVYVCVCVCVCVCGLMHLLNKQQYQT